MMENEKRALEPGLDEEERVFKKQKSVQSADDALETVDDYNHTEENLASVSIASQASPEKASPSPAIETQKIVVDTTALASTEEEEDETAVETEEDSTEQKTTTTPPPPRPSSGFAAFPKTSMNFAKFATSGTGFGSTSTDSAQTTTGFSSFTTPFASSSSSSGSVGGFSSFGTASTKASTFGQVSNATTANTTITENFGFGATNSSIADFQSSIVEGNHVEQSSSTSSSSQQQQQQQRVVNEAQALMDENFKHSNGEERERSVFQVRAKLFKLENSSDWKECGLGPLRILDEVKESASKSSRLVMRRETHVNGPGTKVILNVCLASCTSIESKGEKSVFVSCMDVAQENEPLESQLSTKMKPKPTMYLLRVADSELAQELLSKLMLRMPPVTATTPSSE